MNARLDGVRALGRPADNRVGGCGGYGEDAVEGEAALR